MEDPAIAPAALFLAGAAERLSEAFSDRGMSPPIVLVSFEDFNRLRHTLPPGFALFGAAKTLSNNEVRIANLTIRAVREPPQSGG